MHVRVYTNCSAVSCSRPVAASASGYAGVLHTRLLRSLPARPAPRGEAHHYVAPVVGNDSDDTCGAYRWGTLASAAHAALAERAHRAASTPCDLIQRVAGRNGWRVDLSLLLLHSLSTMLTRPVPCDLSPMATAAAAGAPPRGVKYYARAFHDHRTRSALRSHSQIRRNSLARLYDNAFEIRATFQVQDSRKL